jgi:hypothetical protein
MPNSHRIAVSIDPAITVANLIERISPNPLRIVYHGRVLSPQSTLLACNITPECTLHAIPMANPTPTVTPQNATSRPSSRPPPPPRPTTGAAAAPPLAPNAAASPLEPLGFVEGTPYDLLWGMLAGFFLSLLALLVFYEPKCSQRAKLGVLAGIAFNFSFGIMHLLFS